MSTIALLFTLACTGGRPSGAPIEATATEATPIESADPLANERPTPPTDPPGGTCPPCVPPPCPGCVGNGPCGCGPYDCPVDCRPVGPVVPNQP